MEDSNLEKEYYLYAIKNNINKKFYIGVTKNPYKRWYSHIAPSSKCLKLKNAIKKYGSDNFSMHLICKGSQDYLLNLEIKLIEKLNTTSFGYNIDRGGRGISKKDRPLRPVWDSPVFVSGWWFPSVEVCLENLKWSKDKFLQRKYNGILELTEFKERKDAKPVYYKGFWFPSKQIPCKLFHKSVKNVTNFHRVYMKKVQNGFDL